MRVSFLFISPPAMDVTDLYMITALFWVITQLVVVISYPAYGIDRLYRKVGKKLPLLAV